MFSFAKLFAKRNQKLSSGSLAENIAAKHLQSQQLKILLKNFSCPLGEIDIIAQTAENAIAFIEVRYRKKSLRNAKISINFKKVKKIKKTALWFLKQKFGNQASIPKCRFDVILLSGELEDPLIEYIPSAFT